MCLRFGGMIWDFCAEDQHRAAGLLHDFSSYGAKRDSAPKWVLLSGFRHPLGSMKSYYLKLHSNGASVHTAVTFP
jgi:hypothetical protein